MAPSPSPGPLELSESGSSEDMLGYVSSIRLRGLGGGGSGASFSHLLYILESMTEISCLQLLSCGKEPFPRTVKDVRLQCRMDWEQLFEQ